MVAPKVAAIIPTFNAARTLPQAIDSALAQTHQPLEIIVVDDGSTDGTGDLLRRYSARISVIRQENRGVGAARNVAARSTDARYLAFLDADDYWYPEKIARQLEVFAQYPEVILVATKLITVDSQGRRIFKIPIPASLTDRPVSLYRHLLMRGNHPIGTSAVMLRKDIFDGTNGFIEQRGLLSTDYEFWLRIAESGPFYILAQELAAYRELQFSLHHGNLTREYGAQLDILERHHHRYSWLRYRRRTSIIYHDWADSALDARQRDGWTLLARAVGYNPLNLDAYFLLVRALGSRLLRPLRRHPAAANIIGNP